MVPEVTKLEAETREIIDRNLIAADWVVQDKKRINLYEKLGVAVREMDTDTGPADYMLFVDGKACGIIEAKREGSELGGVAETDKTETKSLETKPSVSTAKLMEQVARGDRHSDTLHALGNRMIRIKYNELEVNCGRITTGGMSSWH